jgi:hypothetical protein
MSSGKMCCSRHFNSCPRVRERNSSSLKGNENYKFRKVNASWNRGLTKETNPSLKRAGEKISKALQGVGHPQTDETRKKISDTMKAVGAGGYRKGSGRGKKGTYKGIYCDSSWELAFVLWCEIKGRKVKRAKRRFEYSYRGKTHYYLPDFRYQNSDGVWKYVEVKGYVSEQWVAKKKAFPEELLMLEHEGMKRYVYPLVHEHFGKNFTRLYE